MQMIYVTGDIHGNPTRIENFCMEHSISNEDILIILGDTGLNYYLDYRDDWLKKRLANLPITIFCIRGNHEERPQNISTYKIKQMFGNDVFYEPKYPNIIFAKDGNIYNIEGNKCLAIGGAYSVDKDYRLACGWTWFKDEQLSKEEMLSIGAGITEYMETDNIDYILTHTCPYNIRPTHLFLSDIDQSTVDTSMEHWMQSLSDILNFKRWYFGHYHDNWNHDKYTMLYTDIIPLGGIYEK
jgi:3-oxoacid CoA-transferase subunit A